MTTSQAGLDPAKTGKRGRKLCPAAQALLVERIISGDDNRRILSRLRTAGLLDEDDALSQRALSYYRHLPLCQVQRDRLTETARTAAHQELSEAIVSLVGQARVARQHIHDNAAHLTAQEIADLAHVQFQSLRLVYHCSGLTWAVPLCDRDSPEQEAGAVKDVLRKWKRADRDGCNAMVKVGL